MEENKKQVLKFPEGFLWGAATSGYQIEGDSPACDWQEWERAGKTYGGKCGKACDYWNLWKGDHKLLEELEVKSFRLSIEWARIEPREGEFSDVAINKYREILQDLKNKNIKTQVTLWHWVSPLWFSEKYGFHKKKSIKKFESYSNKIIEELGDLVDFWVVLNEPMVPLGMGYLKGGFPPGFKNIFKFFRAGNNLARAYKKTYKLIHKKYPEAKVGITYLYNWYEFKGLGFLGRAISRIVKWYRIDFFGNKIKKYQDYMGIDYYRLAEIIFDLKNSQILGFKIKDDQNNPMRWVTYARGLRLVLREAHKKYKKPIYIMENGTPTNQGIEDKSRIEFIDKHLVELNKAITEGIPVLGYNHWSLLDNFEWLEGYRPRFGLVEVDYKTLERKPRKSFYEYAKICKNNEVDLTRPD